FGRRIDLCSEASGEEKPEDTQTVHKIRSGYKKMGWPKPSHSQKTAILLEEELHHKLHCAGALLNSGPAEVCICLRDLFRSRILSEFQRQIVAVRERPQGMVQEVVSLYTEL